MNDEAVELSESEMAEALDRLGTTVLERVKNMEDTLANLTKELVELKEAAKNEEGIVRENFANVGMHIRHLMERVDRADGFIKNLVGTIAQSRVPVRLPRGVLHGRHGNDPRKAEEARGAGARSDGAVGGGGLQSEA